jgi:hypothetical protein
VRYQKLRVAEAFPKMPAKGGGSLLGYGETVGTRHALAALAVGARSRSGVISKTMNDAFQSLESFDAFSFLFAMQLSV